MKKIAQTIITIFVISILVYLIVYLVKKDEPQAPLKLSYQLIQNDIDGNICESQLTFHNTGKDTLHQDWVLHYCQMSLAPLTLPDEQIHIEQVCASYHTVTPTALFEPLAPGESRTFTVRHKSNVLRKSGLPQGAFIVLADQEPITVPVELICTEDGSEYRRGITYFPYADGEWMYEQNARFEVSPQGAGEADGKHVVHELPKRGDVQWTSQSSLSEGGLHLLPTPKHYTLTGGTCNIKKAVIDKHLLGENGELFMCHEGWRAPEGYSLTITEDTIHILAPDEAGAFYAEQTLTQLSEKYEGEIPCLTMTDYPDLRHRGLMVDIARNYTPKEEILRLIDDLSLYKMNVLHLHLTDDEAWRLEIPGLPELTEVGGRRGYTTDERECLYPSYCGGWDMNDPTSTANGYLTREDYIEILRYAKAHHIRVIPEIDMPGHMRAAIKSMEARYHKYIDTDPAKATEYLLTDFNDTSVYLSAQYYTDNVICIALPSCYTFIQKVVDEVVAMYEEADAPLYVFHVGGDEVAKNAWTGSPICQAYMAEKGMTSTYDLKDEFIAQVLDILSAKGLQTEGWEEIAMRKGVANPKFANSNVLSHCWNSVPEWRGDEVPYRLANAGYPVLLGCVTNLYLDMSYVNHEEERALHWGGYTDEYTTFDFLPFDLYRSVRRTMKGLPRDVEAYANSDKVQLDPAAKKNIVGLQAQLFAETIRSVEQLEDYIFPKLFGVAERAWHSYPDFGRFNKDGSLKAEEEIVNYQLSLINFNNEITTYDIPWLAARGRHFHLTQPGIHRDGDMVYMNHPAADAVIRYTLDGSPVTEHSTAYKGAFECTEVDIIHAKAFYCGMESNTTHLR